MQTAAIAANTYQFDFDGQYLTLTSLHLVQKYELCTKVDYYNIDKINNDIFNFVNESSQNVKIYVHNDPDMNEFFLDVTISNNTIVLEYLYGSITIVPLYASQSLKDALSKYCDYLNNL